MKSPGILLRYPEKGSPNIREKSEISSRAIIDDILGALRAGALGPGDRLPNERTLCEKYATGRHTVRKAFDILERRGVIARFVGRGSFIAEGALAQLGGSVADAAETGGNWSLAELTEARLLFEPGFADLIVLRAGREELAEIEAALARIGEATDWRDFKERKYAFHLALAKATRNEFLEHVFQLVIAARRRSVWARLDRQTHGLAEAQRIALDENRRILEALTRGDAAAARDAIRQSLMRIMVSISEL